MLVINKNTTDISKELLLQLKAQKEASLFQVGDEILPICRLSIPINLDDPLMWLAKQNYYPKVFFQDVDKRCALGTIFSTRKIPRIHRKNQEDSSIRFFGGMEFFNEKRKTSLWKDFPSCHFFLPMIEIENDLLHFNLIAPHANFMNYARSVETILTSLDFSDSPIDYHLETPLSRKDLPSKNEWKQNLEDYLGQIRSRSFEKIVAARQTTFTFSKSIHSLHYLHSLLPKMKNSTPFAFQYTPSQAFIGMTPEILYKRENRSIETAAIAGTRPCGEHFLQELLESEKENREFKVVTEFIKEKLGLFSKNLQIERKHSTLETGTVQHFYEVYKGILNQDVLDTDIIASLHPTPAIGGCPKEITVKTLYQTEAFDRGWYASPIGWITPENSHFYVGIRSALIQENMMHAFAGTGIVEGSDPEQEWEELEYKISHFGGL